jgi:hypothetical protein
MLIVSLLTTLADPPALLLGLSISITEVSSVASHNTSHKLQPIDLVLSIWPELRGFHRTTGLLSEVLDWDLAEGDGSTSLMFSSRWHRVVIL